MNGLDQLAEREYQQLRAAHPKMAAYLDLMIIVRPLFGGGYGVLDTIYPTEEDADEARKAAIMLELVRVSRI